ncbi:MAG: hypothetical protein FWG15_08730 [Propionibacteriaceae bacterium]|nr:hypothetical protein [Propionibacteriaceae bacterium]
MVDMGVLSSVVKQDYLPSMVQPCWPFSAGLHKVRREVRQDLQYGTPHALAK